jgi:zinc protease
VNNNIRTMAFITTALIMLLSVPVTAHCLDIRNEQLGNGLTVIHVERNSLPIVAATLLIKASPLQEKTDIAGTAYLTAKMLSEGTIKRKSVDISNQIEFIGASLESSVNDDYTTVSLSVLKKDVATGFDMLSDIVLHPSFPADELARRKILLAGALKKLQEDPSHLATRKFMKELFGDFPYGRQVEGSLESIEKISRFDIVGFYDRWYRPDNAILIVVGDLSKRELTALVEQHFAAWKAGGKNIVREKIVLPKKTGDNKQSTEIIDRDISQANIIMGHTGISRDNPDYYAVQVMNYILGGGGFASRLMKTVRDDMGLTYSIHSSFSANAYPGRFEIDVQTKNENAGRVIDETLKQIRRIRAEGVTDEELRDAKDFMIGSFPGRLETGRKLADFLAAVQFYNLGDDYIERYRDYVRKVTKEDILRVARKYVKEGDMLIVVVGNRKKLKL